MVCRHRTPPIRRRRPRGCTCRLRFCRTRSSRSPAPSISRHFPPSSSAWRLSSMTTQSPRSSNRFFPPDKNAAEVIAWLQRSR
jgi:hypothetical protein